MFLSSPILLKVQSGHIAFIYSDLRFASSNLLHYTWTCMKSNTYHLSYPWIAISILLWGVQSRSWHALAIYGGYGWMKLCQNQAVKSIDVLCNVFNLFFHAVVKCFDVLRNVFSLFYIRFIVGDVTQWVDLRSMKMLILKPKRTLLLW